MGSKSDLDTMRLASEVLRELDISHETKIISAHRTPDLMYDFAKKAKSRGIEVIIAGAGGAAPGRPRAAQLPRRARPLVTAIGNATRARE